jgi:hypothetical protein
MFDVVRVECEVTCPCCGHVEWMQMEPDQSPFALVCDQCRDVSAPPSGECCLFCAFGSCQCLPRQRTSRASDRVDTESLTGGIASGTAPLYGS